MQNIWVDAHEEIYVGIEKKNHKILVIQMVNMIKWLNKKGLDFGWEGISCWLTQQ